MAISQLFIRSRKTLEGIELDAVIQENHANVVRVSDNPVESGAIVSDNAIIDPKRLTLDVQVSNTPRGFLPSGEIVDAVTGLFGSSTASNITRSDKAYRDLVALQEKREVITVETTLVTYSNMMITNISTTRNKDTRNIVRMLIDLQEVRIVESVLTPLPPEKLPEGTTREQGQTAQQKGRLEKVVPTETQNKSIAASIGDFVFGS